ncbi:hypothetical protein C8Q73DRAFT_341416 [Cubamyces lactineus]|nr:hypothetical protein C8Q73DRAFT_341416 [Cubamyces lactineus]
MRASSRMPPVVTVSLMSLAPQHRFSIWAPGIHDISILSSRTALLCLSSSSPLVSILTTIGTRIRVGGRSAPRPVRVGEPCVVYDPRRRISAFPHVDGLLAHCSISRFPRLAVYRISTRTFTSRTLMRCFTSPSSSLFLPPPPFSGLFHVTSVLLLHCSPYTNAQKHTENPQKTPHMLYSPFSRFLPLHLAHRGFLHERRTLLPSSVC